MTVFAGQRAEGFYFDLGSVLDIVNLRPFENLHAQYGLNAFSGPAATASRRRVTMRGASNIDSGPWAQVSRLGNPLAGLDSADSSSASR